MANITHQYKPSSMLKVGRVTKSLNDWAARLGCSVQAIINRLARGYTAERAVNEPISKVGGSTRGTKLPAEILTVEECQKILDLCNDGITGCRNRALIVTGWRAGLRIGEALDLLPHNVNMTTQTIRVLHGKGNKAGTVGIDATALEYLSKWIETRSALKLQKDSPLFCTLNGGKLSSRYVRALMPRLAKEAGILKRCHFHGLRHTHAVELSNEGVPVTEIQQQLRHSSLDITSTYLAHLNPQQTIDRLKGRSWGRSTLVGNRERAPEHVPPDWVDQLRGWLGDGLAMFHDARSTPAIGRAFIVLTD